VDLNLESPRRRARRRGDVRVPLTKHFSEHLPLTGCTLEIWKPRRPSVTARAELQRLWNWLVRIVQ
jgi:hypothetical protein